jgi:hypothetical protein
MLSKPQAPSAPHILLHLTKPAPALNFSRIMHKGMDIAFTFFYKVIRNFFSSVCPAASFAALSTSGFQIPQVLGNPQAEKP